MNVSGQAAELPFASLARQSPLLHPGTVSEQPVAMAHGASPPLLPQKAPHSLPAQSGTWAGKGRRLPGNRAQPSLGMPQWPAGREQEETGEPSPRALPSPTEWPAGTWTEMGPVAFLGLCPQRERGRTLASSAPGSNTPGGRARKWSRKFLGGHLPRQKGTAFLPRRAWVTALLFSRLFERAESVCAATTGPVVVQAAGLPASRRSPLHGQHGPRRESSSHIQAL